MLYTGTAPHSFNWDHGLGQICAPPRNLYMCTLSSCLRSELPQARRPQVALVLPYAPAVSRQDSSTPEEPTSESALAPSGSFSSSSALSQLARAREQTEGKTDALPQGLTRRLPLRASFSKTWRLCLLLSESGFVVLCYDRCMLTPLLVLVGFCGLNRDRFVGVLPADTKCGFPVRVCVFSLWS